jgi:hypothetical protein
VATALFAANRLGKANDKRDTNNYNDLLLNSLVKTAHDLQKIINVPSLFYFCRGDIRTLPPRSLQGRRIDFAGGAAQAASPREIRCHCMPDFHSRLACGWPFLSDFSGHLARPRGAVKVWQVQWPVVQFGEAARRIRQICDSASPSADKVGVGGANKQEIERFKRAAKTTMEIAVKIRTISCVILSYDRPCSFA